MIKKDPIDVLIEKTDKLIDLTTQMLALHTAQPMRKLVVQDGNAKPRKTYTRKVAVAPKKTYKRGINMPNETYEAIRNLPVGGRINMTTWVRANSVSFQQLKDRIYSFGWKNRKNGDNARYAVVRDSWEIYVQRTA